MDPSTSNSTVSTMINRCSTTSTASASSTASHTDNSTITSATSTVTSDRKRCLMPTIFTSEQLSVLRGLDIDTKLQGIEGKRILELACQESGLTRRQVSNWVYCQRAKKVRKETNIKKNTAFTVFAEDFAKNRQCESLVEFSKKKTQAYQALNSEERKQLSDRAQTRNEAAKEASEFMSQQQVIAKRKLLLKQVQQKLKELHDLDVVFVGFYAAKETMPEWQMIGDSSGTTFIENHQQPFLKQLASHYYFEECTRNAVPRVSCKQKRVVVRSIFRKIYSLYMKANTELHPPYSKLSQQLRKVEVSGMPIVHGVPLCYKDPDTYTAEEIDLIWQAKDNLEMTSISWKKNQLPVVTDQDIYVVLPEDTCEGDIYQPNEFGILVRGTTNNDDQLPTHPSMSADHPMLDDQLPTHPSTSADHPMLDDQLPTHPSTSADHLMLDNLQTPDNLPMSDTLPPSMSARPNEQSMAAPSKRIYTKWSENDVKTLCSYFRRSTKRPGKEEITTFLETENSVTHGFGTVKAKLNALYLKYPQSSYPYAEYFTANFG